MYETEAEAFCGELTEEYFRNGAGLKETCDLSPIYEKHSHLFSRPQVEALLARRDSRLGRYLAQFGAFEYLGNSVRELTERITNAETKATVEWEGKPVPYRYASVLLAREPSLEKRHDLHRRLLEVTAQENPGRAERLTRQHAEAKGLGFPSYEVLCDELLGLDLKPLAGQMQELLERTDPRWQAELTSALEAAGISPQEAEICDLRYLLRAPQYGPLFPKEGLLPALKRTLAGLGVDLEAQPNLHLDTEERPLKSPRAFCAPVRIPSDVRLVIMPQGGREDYNALLHEAGHAEHFSHTSAELPFAYRYLGDSSVTEGYAFLFNLLLDNPSWLREAARIEPSPDYFRFARFYQLYYLRRYAAKLLYELDLHAAETPGEEFSARYAQLLSKALGVRVPPESYLADVDDAFYCACYLRAWIFEAQLRRRLEHEFGRAWFRHPRCGELLRGLWRQGQKYAVDELVHQFGYKGLEPQVLVGELTAGATK